MNTITSRNGVELTMHPVRHCAACGENRPGEDVEITSEFHKWGIHIAAGFPLPGFRCAVCGETTLGGAS